MKLEMKYYDKNEMKWREPVIAMKIYQLTSCKAVNIDTTSPFTTKIILSTVWCQEMSSRWSLLIIGIQAWMRWLPSKIWNIFPQKTWRVGSEDVRIHQPLAPSKRTLRGAGIIGSDSSFEPSHRLPSTYPCLIVWPSSKKCCSERSNWTIILFETVIRSSLEPLFK